MMRILWALLVSILVSVSVAEAQIPGAGLFVQGVQTAGLCPIATSTVNLATWGSCGGGGGSVSITSGNGGIVVNPNPITGTGTVTLQPAAASVIGGVESLAATTHQWINTISTLGVPSSTQPAFTDISGQSTLAQLATQAANTVVGNGTGSTASPTALAVPSCSGGTNALIWTSGTGFGCNTIASSGSPGGTNGQIQFNNASAFGGFTASGDATINTGTGALTLSTVNANVGSFGGVNSIPSFTVDAKGRLTAVAANVPAIPFSEVTGQATLAQLPTIPALDTYCNPTTSSAIPTNCPTFIHSLNYATGNGSTDDTTALQNWVNACQTGAGLTCFLDTPSVCYKTSAALSITGNITIDGNAVIINNTGGAICLSSATQDGIDINTSVTKTSVSIRNISIASTATPTAGACISVNGTGFNKASRFEDIYLENCFVGFVFTGALSWVVDSVYIQNPISANITSTLWADSVISNSTLTQASGSTNGVVLTATSTNGGGMKIIGNKFNSAATGETACAVCVTSSATGTLSDLIVEGNSIEQFAFGVQFIQGSFTAFSKANINGNQFVSGTSCIQTDNVTSWIADLTFDGNNCRYNGAVGVAIGGVTNFSVANNVINGSGGSSPAITISSNAVSGQVVHNQIFSTSAAAFITNASTTTRIIDDNGMARASLPASVADGSVIFDKTVNAYDDFVGNTPFPRSSSIFSSSATLTTSGTGVDNLLGATHVGTVTVPANYLVPGKTFRLTIVGRLTTLAIPGTLNATLTLGGTPIAANATPTPTVNQTNAPFVWIIMMTCQSTGATGAVVANGAAIGQNFATMTSSGATVNTAAANAIGLTTTNSIAGGAILVIDTATIETVS